MMTVEEKRMRGSIFEAEMKWTIPILMLLTLTMTFSKGIVWLGYQLNKEFISKNLCINKSRPILKCHGKCQMMKKMAEEEQENSSVPAPKMKNHFDETVILLANIHSRPEKQILTKFNPFAGQPRYIAPVFPVFHPPA